MKPTPLHIAVLLAWLTCLPARADLSGDINTILQDKAIVRVHFGIEIVRLGDSPKQTRAIYSLEPKTPRTPASNLKLITTAAALDRLGTDFRFQTSLIYHDGDLVLIGDGDPTLGDVEMLRKVGWDVTTVYRGWAEQLQKRKIKSIKNIRVDDSVFDEQFVHPHWPSDQEHKRYVAQVGGVNLNANCIDFSVRAGPAGQTVSFSMDPDTRYAAVRNICLSGSNSVWLARQLGGNDIVLRGEARSGAETLASVTIHDPPMFAATVLKETLESAGIQVTGDVIRDREAKTARKKSPKLWPVIAIHETPLAMVLMRANKNSMNLYAEALCKRMGFAATGQSGSWTNGPAAIGGYLKSIGVDADEYRLDDGSGLSKENLISPAAIVRVLSRNYFGPARQPYFASLSVAGVDGTLDDRFRGSDLRQRVFGKSGYVSGVSCLSGYLHARDDNWYAFSIMMNHIPDGSNGGMKLIQEKIIRAVDAHTARPVASGR